MRVVGRLRDFVSRVGEFTAAKRALGECLRAGVGFAPGLWVLPGLGGAWHVTRWRDALRSVGVPKGVVGSRAVRWGSAALALFGLPVVVWVSRSLGDADVIPREAREVRASRVVLTKAGGCIGFDDRSGRVLHVRSTGLPPGYAERRRELATVFRSPDFTVSQDHRVVCEDLVPGPRLVDVDDAGRMHAVADLIAASALTPVIGGSGSGELVRDCVRFLADAGPGGGHGPGAGEYFSRISQQVRELAPAWIAAAQNWPLVLAHGDLTPFNIVIGAGGVPVVLDFEDSGPKPFFYDAASLVIRDRTVLERALAGALDEQLAPVLARAPSGEVDLGTALQVTAVFAAVEHARGHGGDVVGTLTTLWPADLPVGC